MELRQRQLLQLLKQERQASVPMLARALFVSEATVRRDLSLLQSQGLVRRTHGGALLEEAADEVAFSFRIEQNARQKEQIARKAVPLLGNTWSSLFVDASSTALTLARSLNLSNKTVVTNNLKSALMLSHVENIDLILLGGSVYAQGSSVKGSLTLTQLADFHFDVMISSCAALSSDGAYDRSLDQREIKRAAFARASRRILLADATKLTQSAPHLLRPLSDFDAIVMDSLPDTYRDSFASLPIIV